ncbi:MAG: thioredoxin family protein [Erysipelothrix sp.]|jgi:predicted bacteriocin transport accessory protein|nr:thioredoxin family protein [Erysipelothrix sp.]
MKKLLILLALTLALMGCANESFKSTPAAQVTSKLVNLESAIIVFGQSTCSACTEFKPVLEEVIKNYPNTPIYYVETDKDNSSDVATLTQTYLPNATVTPITYFFVDGVLVRQEVGYFRYSQLKSFLIETGFISE